MKEDGTHEMPEAVASLGEKIGEWRRQGKPKAMPSELWTEAARLGRELGVAEISVAAKCLAAGRSDRDVSAALSVFHAHENCLGSVAKMESRFLLWRATKDTEHLAQAKRLLDNLVEHAPENCHESMLQNVRLYREIMEAWAEHGEKAMGDGEAD